MLGANASKNMFHVVVNNGAHETVGDIRSLGYPIFGKA